METDKFEEERKKYNDWWNNLKKKHSLAGSFKDKVEKCDFPIRFEFFGKFMKEGDNVLDCGCQDGYQLYYHMTENKVKGYGIDISDESIEDCKKNLETNILVRDIIHGAVEKMPFVDNTFDVVYSSQMLEHLENPQEAIAEQFRVCKTGGFIINSVPINRELMCENHKHFFRFYDLIDLFDTLGCDYKIHKYWKFHRKHDYNMYIIVAQKGKPIGKNDEVEANKIDR